MCDHPKNKTFPNFCHFNAIFLNILYKIYFVIILQNFKFFVKIFIAYYEFLFTYDKIFFITNQF
jgi:hypothetical protein